MWVTGRVTCRREQREVAGRQEFVGANHMGNDCGRDGTARLGPAVRAEKHRFDATQVIQNNVKKESNPTSLIFEPGIR
jgi:hypothetical protein